MLTIFISGYKADALPFKQNAVAIISCYSFEISVGFGSIPKENSLMVFPLSPAERGTPSPSVCYQPRHHHQGSGADGARCTPTALPARGKNPRQLELLRNSKL